MKETLTYLTKIQPPRNYKNIDSLNKVAQYIKDRFSSFGLETRFQEFEVDGKIYKNVIATINPNHTKTLVMGGHYDVCDDIEGADDNGSAIAGIVESARQLKICEKDLDFKIEFVAFTLEEPPYFLTKNMGSYIHSNYLKENNVDVIGMINYEMIGYFTDEENSQDYPIEQMKLIYPTTGNFIANISDEDSSLFLKQLKFKSDEIESYDIVLPDMLKSITASDHLNYWRIGYKAVMITDTAYLRNKNYHTKNDTLETIDFTKMRYVVNMVVNSVKNLNLEEM